MIELKQINRIFQLGSQTVHALKDVNLRIEPGDYLSIMGPSGSGKSTLLNVIGLLDRPTSGQYWFEGEDVTALDDVQQSKIRMKKIGFIFQFFHLIPRLTAADNITLPLTLAGVPPAERQRIVQKLLPEYGLAARGHHRPEELSGGERQRVAIARATIMHPAILLADEPTGNLDRATGRDVVNLLETLHHNGVALVVVTHDPELGGRAHRQLKMIDGEIVAEKASLVHA
ncbi:MAG TPA: ABC transporter ATP-binding protein [Candidatus Angelobacter sp.]|nr:ABC transporter ATP-binding protein [Candidatus Angelobacter sp.]